MRTLLLYCLYLLILQGPAFTQGRVVTDTLYSIRLENDFSENPRRAVSTYLPPGYDTTGYRYPVIYFLHGFNGDNGVLSGMSELLDFAIETQRIRPFIMVVSDQNTSYGGSFYSNTGIFGDWEDFTTFDLVDYVDANYRTIPDRASRGITGHSMGAYGAIKIAMHYPDVFSSVYGLSPGVLTIVREYGPNSDTYRKLASLDTEEALATNYFPSLIVALGKSWSPAPDNPPFYCDIPFAYEDGGLIVNQEALQKWYDNMPMHMIDDHAGNLRKLTAIKFDWGRNAGERFTIQCKMFSQRLENAGVAHFAEEYIGTHGSGIYTKDGRIPHQMLPFFDFYLEFGEE